jgi:cell wall-associated NlpC family hydrolase
MTLRAAGSVKWSAAGALIAAGLSAFAAEPGGQVPHSAVVLQALMLVDVPYRYGGSSPTGFDCSGLVRYVFKAAAGLELPRRTEEISRVGQPIGLSELQPGDLVFFNTFRRAYSHVAIYVGEGRFLHAPARGGRVRLEALDDRYWKARYDGARRPLGGARGGGAREPSFPLAAGSSEIERITPLSRTIRRHQVD